jgi:SAM-dependent methyltransferase
VCCFGALHLFAEPLAAVDHMARVLRPGGRLALLTSCARSALLVPERVAGRVTGMRIFARHEVTRALAERGFTAIEQRIAGVTQFIGAVAPAAGAGRER